MEYISTKLENKTIIFFFRKWVGWGSKGGSKSSVTVTDVPHEAGCEETKHKRAFNPVLKRERLSIKTRTLGESSGLGHKQK